MTNQITKRALLTNGGLSAGLGASALAVLAQRASADTNFTGFAFPVTGAPTPRTMPDRLAEIINVKDFGAVGDGITNDTSAIQAALDAAFGPSSAPHGGDGHPASFAAPQQYGNKRVFFPAGHYRVHPVHGVRQIQTVVINPDNTATFTTTAPHSFVDKQLVFIWGVQHDTSPDRVNASRVIKPGDAVGGNLTTKFTTYNVVGGIAGLVNNTGTVRVGALNVTAVYGGVLFGAGRMSSVVMTPDAGGIVFHANGWKACSVYDLCFEGPSSTVGTSAQTDGSVGFIFDLDGYGGGYWPIQGTCFDAFYSCQFAGANWGAIVSPTSASQGDTVDFHNCVFFNNGTGCMVGGNNDNAININFFGGEAISNSMYGIYIGRGTIGGCFGTLFTDNGNADTVKGRDVYGICSGGASVTMVGCTSESRNFVEINHCPATIYGCNQRNEQLPGIFVKCHNYPFSIDSCISYNGTVGSQCGGTIKNSEFGCLQPVVKDASNLQPYYIENCCLGGTTKASGTTGGVSGRDPGSMGFASHLRGMMINIGLSQYFIGEKNPITFNGTAPVTPPVTRMRIADLPPGNSGGYITGLTVVVHDCTVTGPKGTIVDDGKHGGSTNKVLLINDGTHWVIV